MPVCELPKAGNYVTYKVGLYSVIIVRGSDGGDPGVSQHVPASRLDALPRQRRERTRRSSAPITSGPTSSTAGCCARGTWTRTSTSRAHGLKPVHCREVAGLVYICLADDAAAFDGFAEQATRYLAPHDLANSKVAYESTIIEKGNWKLVWENNRECYHCAGNHPSLLPHLPRGPEADRQ